MRCLWKWETKCISRYLNWTLDVWSRYHIISMFIDGVYVHYMQVYTTTNKHKLHTTIKVIQDMQLCHWAVQKWLERMSNAKTNYFYTKTDLTWIEIQFKKKNIMYFWCVIVLQKKGLILGYIHFSLICTNLKIWIFNEKKIKYFLSWL